MFNELFACYTGLHPNRTLLTPRKYTKTIKIKLLIIPTLYPTTNQCPEHTKVRSTQTLQRSHSNISHSTFRTENTSTNNSPTLISVKISTFYYLRIDLFIYLLGITAPSPHDIGKTKEKLRTSD
jgi:hypothetical protein